MSDEVTFGPGEVSRLLGVSTSTLRMYAARFDVLLSEPARGGATEDGAGFAHRRYNNEDLQLLRGAKDLLDAGLSYEATLGQLAHGTILSRPVPPSARPRRRAPRPPTGGGRTAEAASAEVTVQVSIPGEVTLGSTSVHPGEVVDEVIPEANLVVAETPSARSSSLDVDGERIRRFSPDADLGAAVHQAVEDAIAPLRAEVTLLVERVEAVAARDVENARALDDLRRQMAWLRQCLDEALHVTEPAHPQSGWLGRVLRRG